MLTCGGGSESSSQNYVYIDPSASDNGNGSESSPYNTFNGLVFEKGTSYLIKRGTILYEQITVNISGTAVEPVIIGAYGTGSDPLIDGSEVVTVWSDSGGDIYSSTLVPAADYGRGNVTVDGIIQKIVTGTPASGEYTISSGGTVEIHGDPSGKTVKLSRRYFGIKGTGVGHITIRDLHIRQASLHGIHFEDSNNILIQNCKIEICGGAYIGSLQAGNGIEFGDSSYKCRVFDSTVTDIFDSGISPQTYNHNKSASDFIFSGNTVSRCGFAGIEVAVLSNGGTTGSSVSNVFIVSNTISECGKGFSGIRYSEEGRGIKIKADNGAGTLSGVVVEQCIVESSAGEGIFISGDTGTVNVNRALLIGNTRGGLLFQHTADLDAKIVMVSSIIRENGDEDHDGVIISTSANTGGFELYHNTFYNNERYGIVINANGKSFTSSILNNNLFHTDSIKFHLVALSEVVTVKNNYFTDFSGSSVIGFNFGTYADYTVAGLNDNSAIDSVSGNIGADDPGLVSAADLNISGTGSPCYRAGVSGTGVTIDYSGKSFNSPPSIGAYEF